LNAEKKKYIHLVDGGVADNVGLRQALDRVTLFGTLWNTLQYAGLENTHKVAFIVVNAETEVTKSLNLFGKPPAFAAMLNSYYSIAITRYNYETVMLLRENFRRWTEEVQKGRCGNEPVSTQPGACGDITFYLIEVKFDALKDEKERSYYKQLPTSFSLSGEQVDKLREVARRILARSEEYRRFLDDLK
jgi:NTE family protein